MRVLSRRSAGGRRLYRGWSNREAVIERSGMQGAVLAEEFNETGKAWGEWRFELHVFFGDGVSELDSPGVERLLRGEGFGRAVAAGEIGFAEIAAAVHGVADDGVLDVGHVYAELMGAAGFGLEADKRVAAEAFCDFVVRDGVLGDVDGVGLDLDGELFADDGVHADGSVDDVGVELQLTFDDGDVGFLDGAAFELHGEAPMCFVGFGDEHDAGGVLVEPVNDTGSEGVAAAAEVVGVVGEGIGERTGLRTVSGVADDIGGFVDREHVLVFVNDFEGDVFRDDFPRFGRRDGEFDEVAVAHFVAALCRERVDGDGAFADEALDGGAGQAGEAAVEIFVESAAWKASADAEPDALEVCVVFGWRLFEDVVVGDGGHGAFPG